MIDSFVSRFTGGALVALLLLSSAGCNSQAPVLVRVGTIPWPGYDSLHAADELGYYGAAVRVRMVEYSSSTQVLRAFRNNSIEVAALTLDETMELAEDIPDLRVVQVLDGSLGADVLLARPGIEQLTDLRGHRIGYEATALGAYMLSRALETAGLRTEQVTLVPIQFDEHEKAFTNGLVDAVVTFEPVRGRLVAAGAKALFSSAQIPGEIVDVLVVRQAFLENNPGAMATLLGGSFRALDDARLSPDAALLAASARLRLTPAQTREAFQLITLPDLAENRRLLVGQPPALRATAARLGALMFQNKLLHQPPALDTLFDGRTVAQLGSPQY